MSRRASAVLSLAMIATSACVYHVPRSRTPGPAAVALPGVPLLDFGDDDCGAGSLATILGYWEISASIDELAAELPTVRRGEVLSVDLLLAAREYGLEARWTSGDQATLVSEIRAGRPVIVLLRVANGPGSRIDYHHYVVVDGVDEALDTIRVLFGDGVARWVPFPRLEKAWRPTEHALLRALPREESVDARGRRGLEAEAAGRFEAAAAFYRKAVDVEPRSTVVWTDLGNALTAAGAPVEAERAYRRALSIDPGAIDALNNLAWLLVEQRGDLAEAERLARAALDSETDPERRRAIRDTLDRVSGSRRSSCAGG